jgi:hypothetical protein
VLLSQRLTARNNIPIRAVIMPFFNNNKNNSGMEQKQTARSKNLNSLLRAAYIKNMLLLVNSNLKRHTGLYTLVACSATHLQVVLIVLT